MLLACGTRLLRLAVERLRCGCWPAALGELRDADRPALRSAGDLEHVVCVDELCRLHTFAVHMHATSDDGLGRQGARLEEPGGPEPFVEADALHDLIMAAARPAIVNRMVQYVDKAFSALADPTRRAVLERLGLGPATISELAEPFGMSLTGMKKHVLVLEDAGLVLTEKVGRARRCTLAPYAFEGITAWLERLDRFAQVVERTKGEA